jgi:hypothetical protein
MTDTRFRAPAPEIQLRYKVDNDAWNATCCESHHEHDSTRMRKQKRNNMLVLSGIGIVVFGFLVRANPLLVVAAAALVTGFSAGLHPVAMLAVLGHAFNENRYVSLVFLPLPVIGLLERHGLQERAKMLITRLRGAIGMLSGCCGTLMTPIAANFNIVPAALLGLDRNALIRAQWPTALLLLLCNTLLMYVLVFRFGPHHA